MTFIIKIGIKSMITLKEINKSFAEGFFGHKKQILFDLNFEINKGEIFGYLGHNGAGKTTTIKIMLNLLRPDSGKVIINGIESIKNDSRSKIGFLPDQAYFYDYLKGKEFLDFSARLFNLNIPDRVNELLQLVKLDSFADLQIRKYSRGMLQRLGFAQALINDPDILILDEPMTGLDPTGRFEMRELLLDLKNQGKTIFFSSHILSDAEMICDRVGILQTGKLISVGKLDELVNEQINSILIECSFQDEQKMRDISNSLPNTHIRDKKLFITLNQEDEIDDKIKLVRNAGGHIISVVPKRQTLEDVFITRATNNAN